jgi:hypothetical protein
MYQLLKSASPAERRNDESCAAGGDWAGTPRSSGKKSQDEEWQKIYDFLGVLLFPFSLRSSVIRRLRYGRIARGDD